MKKPSLKQISLFVVLALALVLGIGAGTQLFAAASPLAGTSWVLNSLNGQLPLSGTSITLQFDGEGNATGSDGCNRFVRSYTTDGNTISFNSGAAAGISTMMACPEAVLTQAAEFTTALDSATEFVARGSALLLLDDNDVVATFVSASQNLDDTSWQVMAYNNGNEAVVGLLEGTEITALFDSNEGLSGNAGCNEYFASYLATDGAILIGRVGATFRFCPEPNGVMDQEAAYLDALRTATTYTIEGNTLEMRDANDAIAVQMARVLTVNLPEPPAGVPTGRVTAANGVNLRSGPGTNFPVLAVAPRNAEGEIVGRSADGRWWVVAVPSAPGGSAWVSSDFVAVSDADEVPVIAAPAPPVVIPAPTAIPWPTPAPWPTPTPVPAPQLSFTVAQSTINQGACTTIQWNVENVQAVWVYPQGQPYRNFPRVGQGSEQVCPPVTTTYEMRVLMRDGSVTTRQVTVNVTPAAPQNPLSGTAWQAVNFNNGQNAVVTPIEGTNLTLRFESGNQLSGNSGCNTFSGGYSVSGNNISIGALGGTQMMCADIDGVMDQEGQFQAALQSARTFRFDGNRLELRTAGDSIAVIFTRLQ